MEVQSQCDAGGLFGVGAKRSNRFGSFTFRNMVLGSSSHHIRRHEDKDKRATIDLRPREDR